MQLPRGATVAVVDGEKLHLYRNEGDEAETRLTAMPAEKVDADHRGSDASHQSSSANPDGHQSEEDGFAIGVADVLNRAALENGITHLMIIAAPQPWASCANTTIRRYRRCSWARCTRISPVTRSRTSNRRLPRIRPDGGPRWRCRRPAERGGKTKHVGPQRRAGQVPQRVPLLAVGMQCGKVKQRKFLMTI